MSNRPAPADSTPRYSRETKRNHPLEDVLLSALPVVPLLSAFAIAFFYNLTVDSPAFLVFDSAHYFQSTDMLYQALQGSSAQLKELSVSLNLDGPILPLFGVLASAAFHCPPSPSNCLPLLVGQCGLHGVSAAVIFVLAQSLCRLGLLLKAPQLESMSDAGVKKTALAVAMATALVFAGNAAGVIACGRYLTETITTTLLLILALVLSQCLKQRAQASYLSPNALPKRWHGFVAYFVAGVVMALLLLAKSALLPLSLVLGALTLAWRADGKALLTGAAAMFGGAVLVLLPVGVFNYVVSGHLQILPDRLPGWNIALGSDTETDGWSAIPIPPLLELNYFDNPLSIIYGIYVQNPAAFVDLTLRKIVRLFWLPWNDFAASVFPGSDLTVLLHQFLELGGLCGGALALCAFAGNNSVRQSRDKAVLYLSLLLAVAWAGHLVFVPFESIPRYAYSSTPFALLLSVFFLSQLDVKAALRWLPCVAGALAFMNMDLTATFVAAGLNFSTAFRLECAFRGAGAATVILMALLELARRLAHRQATSMVLALSALTVVSSFGIAAAFALNSKHVSQWQCQLRGSLAAERSVFVGAEPENVMAKPDWAAVLIDSDRHIDAAAISFNGKALAAKPVSIFDIPNPYKFQPTLIHTMQSEADAEGVPRQALRQWRLVKIPLAALNINGVNKIAVSSGANSRVTVYGDYENGPAHRLIIPSLQSFAVCKVQVGSQGRDGRPLDVIGYPRAQATSVLRAAGLPGGGDLSPAPGKQTGQFRMFILTAKSKGANESECAVDGMTFDNRVLKVH